MEDRSDKLFHIPAAFTAVIMLATFGAASCDLRSDTAKRGVEKFVSSPTPDFKPVETPEPVDAADVLTVDSLVADGPRLSADGRGEKHSLNCTKYNRVQINGDGNTVNIKGGCQQVMINGDRNKVNVEAAMEFVFNGNENKVVHTKFANGKRPLSTDNGQGNSVEHVSASTKK